MKTKFFSSCYCGAFIASTSAQQTIPQKASMSAAVLHKGVKIGELTKAETANLVKGQKEIHQ